MGVKFTNSNINLKIKQIDNTIEKKPVIQIKFSSMMEPVLNNYNIATKELINLILQESKNDFYKLVSKIHKNKKLFKDTLEPLKGASIKHEVKNKWIIILKPRIDIEIDNEIFPLYKSSHEYSSYDFLEICHNKFNSKTKLNT